MDKKLGMTYQSVCALQKANCIHGCIKSSVARRETEGILPLCSGENPPAVLHPALLSSAREIHGHSQDNQRGGTPLLRMNSISAGPNMQVERVGLFNLKERTLWSDLLAPSKQGLQEGGEGM